MCSGTSSPGRATIPSGKSGNSLRSRSGTPASLCLALLLAAALAGCGGGGRSEASGPTLTRALTAAYYAPLHDFDSGNVRRLCDDLTPRTARELARGLKARSCEAAFTLVLGTAQTTYSVTQTLIAMPTVLLVDVRRHDDIATAELRSKSKADGIARFSFVGGHWRLDAPAPRGQYSRDCKSDACSTVATLSFIYGGR